MRASIFILGIALLLGLAFTACGQQAPTPTPTSVPAVAPTAIPPTPTATRVAPAPTPTVAPATGTVQVRVTDAPPDGVSKVMVTASKIEAQISGADGEAGWTTIVETPPVFDLVAVTGLEEVLGQSTLAAGSYGQVRLAVTKVVVTIQGKDQDADVPSDKLRVVGGFQVAAGQTTVLTLDFDADKSVVLAGPRVQFKPVVKLLAKAPSSQPEPPKKAALTKATVKVTAHPKLGNILTDLNGRTLYLFSRDERNKSNCAGGCAQTWPPLMTAGDPTAGNGVTQTTLGVIQRTEGGTQVVYNGWPLYYYAQDTVAGDAKGQNVGTIWFVLSGDGSPIQDAALIKTGSNPALGTFIADRSGRTLYLYTRDEPNLSNCSGGCARAWPPVLTIGDPTVGEGVAANLLGTIKRTEGSTQVTYKGYPLYYYNRDNKPGDVIGQNVGSVWYVISASGESITNLATMSINLKPQAGQTQSGTAVLTAKGSQTEVVVTLSAGPAGAAVEQPVHIHDGSCSTLGGVKFPLANLIEGKSTTLVNTTLESLRTGGFAINAHKSGPEAAVYTACGEIPGRAVSVNLRPQQGQTQSGTALLTAKGSQTEVVINLSAGPAGAAVEQPVHIHDGSCPTVGGVKFPLANLIEGKSTTLVNTALESLRTGGFAINVHKSGPEAAVYTSCGDIPAKATAATTPATFQTTIKDFALPNITVPVGTTVTWSQQDVEGHRIATGQNGKFDGVGWSSGILQRGQTFSYTFTKVGSFSYTCPLHPSMNATVTVVQAGTPSSSTPASSMGTSGGDGSDYY